MPLKSRSGLTPQQRRKVSFWTSVGICAAACVVGFVAQRLDDGSIDPASRRLSLYPTDPILGHQPYKDAPPERKVGIVLHIILIGYMLLGLNTVCDIYFTGALEIMVDVWKIKPDVAGATFMAAGGSAPELFASLIGATITQNDVGFGTIVGSAVFNVLFVIGACGVAARKPIVLTWWPLFRDCTYYIFGLGLLAVFAKDEAIKFHEAAILFAAYLVYCFIMYKNAYLAEKTDTEFMKKLTRGGTIASLGSKGSDKSKASARSNQIAPASDDVEMGGAEDEKPQAEGGDLRTTAASADAKEGPPGPPEHHRGMVQEPESDAVTKLDLIEAASVNDDELKPGCRNQSSLSTEDVQTVDGMDKSEKTLDDDSKSGSEKKDGEEEEEEEEEDEDPVVEMMTIPEEGWDRIFWFICSPIYFALYYGLPKPSEKMFVATFAISLLWIAGFAFFLVWWVEIVGGALYVPTIIQGFTILAAGTSIPDMASSIAVARKGEGDMAVSSSIGSNIFDILVGLPIPWMIKIGLVERDIDYFVALASPYLAFHVLVLLGMVFAVILSIHCLGWRLHWHLGVCMGSLYVVFLITACGVELTEPEWLKLK